MAERDSHPTIEPANPDGLTLKQTLFVEAYLGEAAGNATRAAKIAGYQGTPGTLRNVGSELLRRDDISSRIRARIEQITGDTTAILQQVWQVATAPTSHFMIVTREEQCDADGTRVRDMQIRQDYSAKVRALELLMKYHGMLHDKPPVETTVKALIGVDLNRI